MNNNKIELLSPAGSIESFKAACQNGADAVYMGVDKYNARAMAVNFGINEYIECIEYAHIRGIKVYLTLNTLMYDDEIKEALDIVLKLYSKGLDAVIIQDIGLGMLIHKLIPKLPLHASTQMSVYSLDQVKYLEGIGFKRVVLARELSVDEIEYISYFSKQNKHWKDDYFEFWQTLWSEQSTFANLCFIICGVNAYVTEKDSINGIQNPLFGIIQSEYLVGLSLEETSQMTKTLGRRMGLKFEYDCIQFLYEQYGGHPLLTRMACSWINRYLTTESRPLILSKQRVQEMQKGFDSDPAFYSYFGHIISEIREFYPDEYEMLELLAAGQISDFIELSSVNEFVQHLNSYGLISWEKGIPSISLPVAGRYIAIELAKKEGRKSIYKLIDKNERSKWLTVRINIIIESMRSLEASIRSCKKDELYGVNSFPEAEKLNTVPVAVDNQTFSTFINVFYRCFVESINNYGKTIQKDHYLDNVIKSSYPLLFKTFDKIKEYRNEQDHLLLTSYHKQKLDEYLSEDLENSLETPDKYFCLQQKIVIELITNIYGESMGLE